LSGGRRRRLAVAATEVTEPDWLLLDEPSAGLDRSSLRRLLSTLAERRAAGRGAIVVTHDPEDWLSLADSVVLIRDGRAIWSGSPAELADHPEWWGKAGLELPEPLRTAEWLRRSGFRPPSGFPDPETLAEALASQAAGSMPDRSPPPVPDDSAARQSYAADGRDAFVAGADAACSRLADERTQPLADGLVAAGMERGADRTGPPGGITPSVPQAGSGLREPGSGRLSPFTAFEPRALWLACLAVTAGIGIQTSWAGWLLGAVTSLLVIRCSGVPPRVFAKPAKALLLFALLTSLFAGWSPSSAAAFDAHSAVETFRRFSKLAMMALLGYSLMAGISPYRLKRSLEKGLHPLAGLGLPVGRFALSASLLLRFLPLLLESWDRFARIAASRGKRPVKPGSVPLPLVAMTVVPFLLALIRLGESLADMLALRGAGGRPERSGRLAAGQSPRHAESPAIARRGAPGRRHRRPGDPAPAFSRRDLLLIAGSVLLFALFLLTENTA
jgi:energy-coupling factor transport system ATP-binding protein